MFRKIKISRKEINNITLNRIIINFFVIIFLVLSPGPVSAYERPEFNDGTAGNWHPGAFCVPCHYMLAGTEKAKAINRNCDNCHKFREIGAYFNTKKIDMQKIVDIHADMVCIRCHVGAKSQTNVTASDFHRVMSKTPCLSCHTIENGTYVKPSRTECSYCHSGDPHVAHGKKLEGLCVACHGEFGEKYANNSIEAGDAMIPISLSNITALSEITQSEYPTIGQLIIKLVEQFTQILG